MPRYSRRESLFEKAERAWTVDASSLHVSRPGRDGVAVRFADITRLRLSYAPTRLKPNRFACTVFARDGRTFSTDNMHFRGLADFEDRSDSYRAMVEALLDGISADRPEFKVDIGASGWWIVLVLLVAAYVAVAVLLMLAGGWLMAAVIGLPGLAISLPLLLRWLKHTRPRIAPIGALPPDALP